MGLGGAVGGVGGGWRWSSWGSMSGSILGSSGAEWRDGTPTTNYGKWVGGWVGRGGGEGAGKWVGGGVESNSVRNSGARTGSLLFRDTYLWFQVFGSRF